MEDEKYLITNEQIIMALEVLNRFSVFVVDKQRDGIEISEEGNCFLKMDCDSSDEKNVYSFQDLMNLAENIPDEEKILWKMKYG